MGLSEYQKATVKHLCDVYKKQKAYIVADEVGLGKTYVAIGLIEKLKAKRIIYIASNAEIAKENVKSIIKDSDGIQMLSGDRLSMVDTSNLSMENKYIISLSPATTFTGIGSPVGTTKERAYYIEHIKNIVDNEMTSDDIIKCLNKYDETSIRIPTKEIKDCISKCRKIFNDYKLKEYNPDLIIMDEFHRFHSLLAMKQQNENAYSMWGILGKDDCNTKILLLSATPYIYSQDKIIRNYNIDAEKMEEERNDPDKAFGSFKDLINYLNAINGKDSVTSIPDIKTIYETIMCRTQRNWLQNDLTAVKKSIRPVITEVDMNLMAEHFSYLYDMRSTLKVSEVIAKRNNGEMIGDGSNSAFIEQAPAFEQFGEKYKFSEYTKSNDKLENKRAIFSEKLKDNANYFIRRNKSDRDDWIQVETDSFEKCLKDYKIHKLIKLAMPAQCEMLLWVLPTILQSADKAQWTPVGIADENIDSLKLFSKTLVFAHYRLSTSAISAITSIEANRRLDTIINDARKSVDFKSKQTVEDILLGKSEFSEKIIDIIKGVILNLTIDEEMIKNEVKKFFDTSYARRVLAAWSYLVNNSSVSSDEVITPQNVIEKYAENFKFKEMLIEYRDIVGKGFEEMIFTTKVKKKVSPGSMGWSDGERTRVIIFPDFVEKTYPLTFAERYYSDYSDKSSHDTSEKEENPRLNTSKRLEAIRIRFQSPFYPFILAASETAQEGVNLHNYCINIIHWSVPSSVRVYTQEEGRVDRRGSLAIRRQMVELYNYWYHLKEKEMDTIETMFFNAGKICRDLGLGEKIELAEKSGLFPNWFLPTDKEKNIFPRLNSEMFCIPFGNEYEAYKDLAYYVEQYVTFGIKKETGEIYSDNELRDGLCPFHDENCY